MGWQALGDQGEADSEGVAARGWPEWQLHGSLGATQRKSRGAASGRWQRGGTNGELGPFIGERWSKGSRRGSGCGRIRSGESGCAGEAAIGRRHHWPEKRSSGDRILRALGKEDSVGQARFCRAEGLVRSSVCLVASNTGLGVAWRLFR